MNAERAVKRAPSPCACVSIAEQSEDVLRVTHGNSRLLRNVSLRKDCCSRAKVSGVPFGDLPCVEAVACNIHQRLTARISGKVVYGTAVRIMQPPGDSPGADRLGRTHPPPSASPNPGWSALCPGSRSSRQPA